MSGKEIYDNFTTAPGAQELESARAVLEALAKEDAEIGDEVNAAAGALESAWEGEAAGAAHRGAGPLAVDHALSSEQATVAQDLLRRQVESFDYAKSNVVPVPDVPDTPPSLTEVVADPAAATYYQRKQEALAAEDQNVRVMNLWDNHSTYNEQMMPTRYGNDGAMTFKSADIGSGPGTSVGSGPSVPQVGGSSGASPGATGTSGAIGGIAGSTGGATSGTRSSTASRSGSSGSGSGVTRSAAAKTPPTGRLPGTAPRPGADTPAGRPGPTSGLPGGGVTGIGPGGGAGSVPRGGVPTGGTRGGVPGSGGGLRGGVPGGPGAGGMRGGVPGTGGQPGRLTGGAPGAPGAGGPGGAGAQAGRGATSGGRGGAPGMMGGGAGRGKGDDDAEHRNKYALPEQLDDGLPREVDEHGERTIDEQSGHTVVPPVIGESDTSAAPPAAEPQPKSQPKPAPGEACVARGAGSANPYLPPSAGQRPRQP